MPEKKKSGFRKMLDRVTGAEAVARGLRNEGAGATMTTPPAAPSLSPKRDPKYQTQGIFDQGKFDDAQAAKKRQQQPKKRRRLFGMGG